MLIIFLRSYPWLKKVTWHGKIEKKVEETNRTTIVCLFVTRQLKGNPFLVFNINFYLYIFSLFGLVFFLLNCTSFQWSERFASRFKQAKCEAGPCHFFVLRAPLSSGIWKEFKRSFGIMLNSRSKILIMGYALYQLFLVWYYGEQRMVAESWERDPLKFSF